MSGPGLTPRRKGAPMTYPENWEVTFETTLNGRHVVQGQLLSFTGIAGKWSFEKRVHNHANGAEWVSVFGPQGRVEPPRSRDFRPERVKTVHRLGSHA